MNRRTIGLLMATMLIGIPAMAGDAPKVGGDFETIEITSSLRKFGQGRVYEFALPLKQGDRFRFEVVPVNGADLPSRIHVLTPNSKGQYTVRFDQSSTGKRQDWTMTKRPPGTIVQVWIIGYGEGQLKIRVSKADDGEDPEEKKLREKIRELERQIEELRKKKEK